MSLERAAARAAAALARVARGRSSSGAGCEVCGASMAAGHRHLLRRAGRAIACACVPCSMLFPPEGRGEFVAIPAEVHRLPDPQTPRGLLEELDVPVGAAFLVRRAEGGAALYPGPLGVATRALDGPTWQRATASAAALAELTPEVEALAILQLREGTRAYRVGLDVCFALAGSQRHRSGLGPDALDEMHQQLRAWAAGGRLH